MGKKFAAYLLAVFISTAGLAAMVDGCTRSTDMDVVESTYQSLQVSGVLYDAAMTAASEAHRDGLLTDREWEQVKGAGRAYYSSYQAAASALGIYMEMIEDTEGHRYDRAELRKLLTDQSESLRTFLYELKSLGVTLRGATYVDKD